MFVVNNLFRGGNKSIYLSFDWMKHYVFAWEELRLIGISIFRLMFNSDFSNLLLFDDKGILTLTMNRYLILISVDFYTTLFLHFRLSSSFYWDDLSNTWHSSSKVLCYVSYFQRFSRCLWNVVKYGVSCLIYFFTSD